MAKKYAIPTDIMLDLRDYFSGRRQEIANKAGMHYNSVTAVLKGERYIEQILQATVELLNEESQNDDAFNLSQRVVKLIKTKQRVQRAIAA